MAVAQLGRLPAPPPQYSVQEEAEAVHPVTVPAAVLAARGPPPGSAAAVFHPWQKAVSRVRAAAAARALEVGPPEVPDLALEAE